MDLVGVSVLTREAVNFWRMALLRGVSIYKSCYWNQYCSDNGKQLHGVRIAASRALLSSTLSWCGSDVENETLRGERTWRDGRNSSSSATSVYLSSVFFAVAGQQPASCVHLFPSLKIWDRFYGYCRHNTLDSQRRSDNVETEIFPEYHNSFSWSVWNFPFHQLKKKRRLYFRYFLFVSDVIEETNKNFIYEINVHQSGVCLLRRQEVTGARMFVIFTSSHGNLMALDRHDQEPSRRAPGWCV